MGVAEAVLWVAVPERLLLLSWERDDGLLLYRSKTYVGGPVDPAERTRWRAGELGLKPDAQIILHDGAHPWSVQTNAEGLRENREIPGDRIAERQLLLLGDSWAFGVSAGQGRTIADHLERSLPGRLGVKTVEVINGGIPGANGFHMLRRYNYLVDRLTLDGLVLGLPHNAPESELAAKRQRWYQSAAGAPYMRSRVYLVLRRLILPMSRTRYPDALTGQSMGHAAMTIADLKTISTDANRRGVPVWLLLWPNDMAAAQGGPPELDSWVTPLAEYLEGWGGHGLKERSCWGFEDTWHPSESGYGAIAAIAADVISDGFRSTTLADRPTCQEIPGAGPGK